MFFVHKNSVYRQAATTKNSYIEAEIFAGDPHLGFIVVKNKKFLQKEAEQIYEWSKEDFDKWSQGEPFGPLRIESSSFRTEMLEAVVDDLAGNQYRDDSDRTYLDQALAELEERGAWQP